MPLIHNRGVFIPTRRASEFPLRHGVPFQRRVSEMERSIARNSLALRVGIGHLATYATGQSPEFPPP